jgi:hypothetical protein
MGAIRVTSWKLSLNGRIVRRGGGAMRKLGVRVFRPGRKRWRVTGYDAHSGELVCAARSGSAGR